MIYDVCPARYKKSEPEIPSNKKVVVHHYSDEGASANARRVSMTTISEPIYKDGKATGEWRACLRRKYWPSELCSIGSKMPWEHVFRTKDAMEEWEQLIVEEER